MKELESAEGEEKGEVADNLAILRWGCSGMKAPSEMVLPQWRDRTGSDELDLLKGRNQCQYSVFVTGVAY